MTGKETAMEQRDDFPEKTTNLLITSGLILLICIILAAMAYFSFSLGILTPPGASDAPSRIGGSPSGTGVASPGGEAAPQSADVGDIIFPGFVDFSITNGRNFVELKNSSENKVYFRFTLTDENGQVLYATENIQPGMGEQWQVTSAFDPGTGKHPITVRIDSFGVADGNQYNGIQSTFTVDCG
jgi:hypothetical protein